MVSRTAIRRWLAALILLVAASRAHALTADEILLIVNGNSPISLDAAKFYAEQRHVPANQLLTLDLDSREEITREEYVHKIETPVRAYLEKNDPQQHIKCLLTFIGLPIRIANRTITADQRAELQEIRDAMGPVESASLAETKKIEALAQQLDPAYKAPTDLTVLPALPIRADAAITRVLARLELQKDPAIRRAVLEKLFESLDVLTGAAGHLQRPMFRDLPVYATTQSTQPTTASSRAAAPEPVEEAKLPPGELSPVRARRLAEAKERMDAAVVKIRELTAKPDDAAARAELRDLARTQLGALLFARILQAQADGLEPAESTAAIDSELALVKWGDAYPLSRWVENPLYFRNRQRMAKSPPTMMVMRLDGPQDGTPRQIITTSINAEETGLGGTFVIDSRGIPAVKADGSPDPYGVYDQSLRNLAALIRTHTKIPLVFDEQPTVLLPNSVKDVGIYIGWYAVRNYTPACQFRPGAVGMHIASYEMISLKSAGERGWVAGLLNDGVAATFGAVNEPYLHSFPRADEFFPLLLTGQMTLAEVYWRTTPLVSWQISMIGDPLYTPFRLHPALRASDLPITLQPALHDAFAPDDADNRPAGEK